LKKLAITLFIAVALVSAQQNENQASDLSQNNQVSLMDSNSFVNKAVEDFMSTKKQRKVSGYWYVGSVLGGAGAVSLVAGSHFDGIAATHRNKAAIARDYIAKNSNQANTEERAIYASERNQMQTWDDRKTIAWQLGLGLGVVGACFMAYDVFVARDKLTLEMKPNGFTVASRF
jgi:hypothetical protein